MVDRLVSWLPTALLAGLLVAVTRLGAAPLADPDTWWNLRLGNQMIDQHSLSAPDHWSTFGTVAWAPTEPLPEIIAAYAERWFGLPGVAWLTGLALNLIVLALYLCLRRVGDALPAALATTLCVIGASLSLTPRPQLLSFALLPVVLVAWTGSERDLRPRWWLVPLTWLWSMIHGFWLFGVAFGALAVVGIALERRPRTVEVARLALVPVLSTVVVLLNPAGPGVLEAPFRVNEVARFVHEWQRTHLPSVAPGVVLSMIAFVVVVCALNRRRPSWTVVLLALAAVFLTWYATRTVAVAAVAAAFVLCRSLSSAEPEPGPVTAREVPDTALLIGCSVACLAVLAAVVPSTADHPEKVPTGLDASLDRLPVGSTVLNTYSVGGWIRWRHPDLNQMIDGLATPYPATYVDRYQAAMYGEPGWRRFVKETKPRAALLHTDVPLVQNLESLGWQRVGTDGSWILLEPGNGS